MLTDRENRPALAVALALHASMSFFLACAVLLAPLDGLVVLLALLIPLLYFACCVGCIAWLAEVPLVRTLNASRSWVAQAAGSFLFLAGLVATVALVTATWTHVSVWSYAGFAILSGGASCRQFRALAASERPPPPALPSARLVP